MLVDVVVRDGKDRPVTDLTAADFEVLEDGVPQTLQQFEGPKGTPAPSAPEGAAVKPVSAPDSSVVSAAGASGVSTMAFVFDRLSTEGRVAAQRAARDYLRERRPQDVAGLFSIENTLVILQDFTSDAALVQAGIDALGTRVAQSGSSALAQARAQTGARLAANAARAALINMPTPRNAAEGTARAQAQIVATQLSRPRPPPTPSTISSATSTGS